MKILVNISHRYHIKIISKHLEVPLVLYINGEFDRNYAHKTFI